MLFSSITFLYYFMPITFSVYYVLPMRFKNGFLFSMSLLFYAWGEPKYVFIMLFSIISSFLFGLLIEKTDDDKKRKLYLVLACSVGIGLLAYFKYADFLLMNIQLFFQNKIGLLHLALPIGISFFTFQTISYTIDVYRNDTVASKNIIDYGAYVSMFPQLIAGPIVRYMDIQKQLTNRTISFNQIYDGLGRFVIGLSKKILIANTLGQLCEVFLNTKELSVSFYWLYAITFSLHIYFDFCAYSDMAIGLGKMLGFEFLENFNYPFISKNITEFWRRWHMSLGGWFKDYVYIPMGGNRKGLKRTLFNIVVVWALTGLWHGASYNFILWGLLFAILLVAEKMFLLEWLKRQWAWVGHIYTLFFVMISFVLFNATNLSQAQFHIMGLFSFHSLPIINEYSAYYFSSYAFIIVLAMVGSTPFVKEGYRKIKTKYQLDWIEPIGMVCLLVLCTAFLVDNSFNPFLYFRF